MNFSYRHDIDGLRSLAVLPVILFHAGLSFFSGGYVGVDVFFVISGYLITTIIVNEISDDNFSLINFYERRVRRILPALYFVIIVCLPFAWFWMMPFQLRDFSISIVAVVFFASNILFWKKSNYFEPDAEDNPLLHTWSLGVEEQYYLIFPLLVIFLWRFGNKPFIFILFLFTFASLFASDYFSRLYPSANFYLAPTRVWELLVGSLIALILRERVIKHSNILSSIGLTMILISIFTFDENTRFPSFYTLIPVVGAALVILFSSSETLVGKLLSFRIFVFIGLLSYSAYLWHQPLFAFARIKSFGEPNEFIMLSLIGLTFLLSFISWRYVESLFRNRNIFTRVQVFSFFFLLTIVFSVTGLIGFLSNGFYSYKSELITNKNKIYLFDRQKEFMDRDRYWNEYFFPNKITDNSFSSKKNKVLIIGDSVAKDFYLASIYIPKIDEFYELRYFGLDDSCMGSLKVIKNDGICLKRILSLKEEKLIEDSDIIILAAHWMKDTWKNAIKLSLEIPDKSVYIIGNLKVVEVSSLAMRAAQQDLSYDNLMLLSYEALNEEMKYSALINRELRQKKELSSVRYLDKKDAFCDSKKKKCNFFNVESGRPLIWDDMHITKEGIKPFSRWIEREVLTIPEPHKVQ